MSKIRSKHTKPERLFRRLLQKKKIKYRLHYGTEKIDVALTQRKIAIFIDGCFWHQCPKHSHLPKSNKKYWVPKLKKNKIRAKEKDKRLRKKGWKIIHVWEHDLTGKNFGTAVLKFLRVVTKKIEGGAGGSTKRCVK